MPEPRVLLYARYPAVRAGLRELLALGGLEVAGELQLGSAAPTWRETADSWDGPSDVLVADLGGGEQPGDLLHALAAPLAAVFLVDRSDGALVNAQRRRDGEPVTGWLLRDAGVEELAAAVRAVGAGLVVMPPELAVLAATTAARPAFDEAADDIRLTPRETDVLRLIAVGLPNKAVALQLGISEHTVKFHVGAVLSKLDASSRAEAVMTAARRGLLPL
ncbi:MAG: DNA-binding response regulator [Dehalococcoidia bacterium]|nr:DNA-binding response regulator [Dehalococcoidia bacterium]